MDFVLSRELLLTLMAGLPSADELSVGFLEFVGSTFPKMVRPDTTYYPVLAVICLPTGCKLLTFDDYRIETGFTALIYPAYREDKATVQKALIEKVIPELRSWFEKWQAAGQNQCAECYYALHDRTFHELAFGSISVSGYAQRVSYFSPSHVHAMQR